MKVLDSIFETMSPIIALLVIGSLVIWMLNSGANDWGIMHKISMSMAIVGLLCSILLLLFCIAYGVFCLIKWMNIYLGGDMK